MEAGGKHFENYSAMRAKDPMTLINQSGTAALALAAQATATGRQHFGIDVPFMSYLGLECISLDDNCCHTRLHPRHELLNSRGDMHGGALMGALDFSLSVAARSHDPLACGAATIDMTTHFYDPANTTFDVIACCTKRGQRIAFCEAEARASNGQVLAVARAVFRLVYSAR